MAYLSMSAIIAEANRAENDAQRFIDLTVLGVNPKPKEKKEIGKGAEKADVAPIVRRQGGDK